MRMITKQLGLGSFETLLGIQLLENYYLQKLPQIVWPDLWNYVYLPAILGEVGVIHILVMWAQ